MAISGQDFWTQFLTVLEGGQLKSSVQFYLPNEGSGSTAQPGEWANVIEQTFARTAPGSEDRITLVNLLADAGFWAPTDELQFWIDQTLGSQDVENLKNAAEERFPQMFGADGTPTGIGQDGGGVGAPKGILGGGQLVKVERSDGTSYFAMKYDMAGIEHLYSFGSEEIARQAVGNLDGAIAMQDSDVNDGDTWLLGDANGLVGLDGDYSVYFDGIMGEAALEAGIRNPGMLGKYAADKDIMRIMAEAEAGGWGDARIQAEVRRTDFYLNVLYPGIDKILEQGIGDPETAWKNYNRAVESTLNALGYARDEDGSYRSRIGEMLTKGITDEEFVESAGLFIRAEQSPEFRNILDQWVLDATGKNISFDQWFDVLAGTTDAELGDIVERATIQFQAQGANIALTTDQIKRIAELTQFSEQQVGASFSSVEQTLLALGDTGLARYSLSVQKLVDATLDIGEDAARTRNLANKAITELGLQDDPKAQFFTGFTQAGRPVKTGLLAGAPEAG